MQDQPTNIGYASAKNLVWEEFNYSNIAGSPSSIINVTVFLYVDCGSEKIRVHIYDSGAGSFVNVGDLTSSGYEWKSINITTTLTTEAEVNNAKLKLESRAVGGWSGSVYADASYLLVHYNVAGNDYEQVITESVDVDDNFNDYAFLTQTLTENITILDNFNDYAYFLAIMNENITLLDQFNDYANFTRIFTENITILDSYHDIIPYFLTVTENITILDSYNSYIISDAIPPFCRRSISYPSIAGEINTFSTLWSDNVELAGYIFSSNNTGSWVNDTWIQFPDNPLIAWANVTKTLNSSSGYRIDWVVYANDTNGNWGINTPTYEYIVIWSGDSLGLNDMVFIFCLVQLGLGILALAGIPYLGIIAVFLGFLLLVPLPIATTGTFIHDFQIYTLVISCIMALIAVTLHWDKMT